jgi:hypothetical protein
MESMKAKLLKALRPFLLLFCLNLKKEKVRNKKLN